MNELINRNYLSIVKRGLINKHTKPTDFVLKLEEEVQEFIDAWKTGNGNKNEELSDIILVCLNIANHYNIDIEKELINKIEINENR